MVSNYSIETNNLNIGYIVGGKKRIVHRSLNLQLHTGAVTCLLGLNGAGKSTLLRTISGFQKGLGGEILVKGRAINSYTQSELALIIGVVLTEKTNTGGISVYELVSLGRHPYTGFFGRLSAKDDQIIRDSMEAVGIQHKADSYVSELSDGERQKAMIAKVLAQQCEIIVLDEPTAFLDVTSRIETMRLLNRLSREKGKSILLSSHDLDLAIQMGDILWLQSKERAVSVGTPEDLIMSGKLGQFFSRNGISFEESTGRLNISPSSGSPIGIDGEITSSYWLGNALIRNGFVPSVPSSEYLSVKCNSATSFSVYFPGGAVLETHSVQEVIQIVSKKS